jgi:hypothetical protein
MSALRCLLRPSHLSLLGKSNFMRVHVEGVASGQLVSLLLYLDSSLGFFFLFPINSITEALRLLP